MAGPTTIPFGHAMAVKRWSPKLFVDITKKSYWDRKFVGKSDESVIQRLTDLEQAAGDKISYDLSVQLRNRPTTGDNVLDGKEESLRFATDEVNIDQMRHGVSIGGKMTQKRTAHNLREIGKDRLSDYWSKYLDELLFIYLSGARGINQDFVEPTDYTGHAGNTIDAPDTGHIMYGGDASAKNNVDSSDIMSVDLVERAEVKARTMRTVDPTVVNMQPVMINGSPHYVLVMHPFQEHSMRTASGGKWLDIQKAAAAAEGRANPIFKGGMGMVKNVVLHSHESVIRFSDYGSGVNLLAARALFLGRQAGVIAWGTAGGKALGERRRFDWSEEVKDHGNRHSIATGMILGVKKTRFASKDFGVLSLDTYAANPG